MHHDRCYSIHIRELDWCFGKANQSTKDVYKKSRSLRTKLRHCNTLIKPEGFYATETLDPSSRGLLEQLIFCYKATLILRFMLFKQ